MSGEKRRFDLKVKVYFKDSEEARMWFKALVLEEKVPRSFRSKIEFCQWGANLVVNVSSGDLSSFRAALNSVLRLLHAVERVSVILERMT